jgi:hypothetical protein
MYEHETKLPKFGRSHVVIRREEGQPDSVKHLPSSASEFDAIDWCEDDGFKVIGHAIIETPNDPKYIGFTIVEVQPKKP